MRSFQYLWPAGLPEYKRESQWMALKGSTWLLSLRLW